MVALQACGPRAALAPSRHARSVRCSATPASRRALLFSAATLPVLALPPSSLAEEAEILAVDALPLPYRRAQRAIYETELVNALRAAAPTLDQRALTRLFFNDAAAGGRDGSVHLPEELARAENAGLAPTVARLAEIKAAVDAASTTEYPLSWTDLLAFSAAVVARYNFREILRSRLTQPADGTPAFIPPGLGNDFGRPVLGGVDATTPAPAGLIPGPGAGVAEWRSCFSRLKLGLDALAVLGPEVCGPDEAANLAMLRADKDVAAAIDRAASSAAQVGRTSYEVVYARAFETLYRAGFTKDEFAYCYPEKKIKIRL